MDFKDFDTAWSLTGQNKQRIYAKTSGDGRSGFERAIGPTFPLITIKPKFSLSNTAPVFTIGSCFAREVENALTKRGFDCITRKCIIEDQFYERTGIGARNGALNAYTPHSMLSLLELCGRADAAAAGMLHLEDDVVVDMLMSGLRPMSKAEAAAIREKLLQVYGALETAQTVVVTLGYTETWHDTQDGIYVNRSPAAARATIRHGGRFRFANAQAGDVLPALDGIISQIATQTRGQAKIILTTSPVPLHATFTDRDVICANMYSKSTLLSCAVVAASKYDFVDYFPSFELVTLSPPSEAWTDDGVHVKPGLVEKILAQFAEAYVASAPA